MAVDETANIEFTVDESLILVKDAAQSREEIIRKLGGLLFQNGFVKDSYVQAVLDREVTFPTGLPAKVAGVAVPHTDTDHVIKPAIAIATLDKPVPFQMMGGTPDQTVQVEIVIMLAVHDAKLVIPVLRKVIFILENEEALKRIQQATNKTEIKAAMLKHIEDMNKKQKK